MGARRLATILDSVDASALSARLLEEVCGLQFYVGEQPVARLDELNRTRIAVAGFATWYVPSRIRSISHVPGTNQALIEAGFSAHIDTDEPVNKDAVASIYSVVRKSTLSAVTVNPVTSVRGNKASVRLGESAVQAWRRGEYLLGSMNAQVFYAPSE